MKEWKERGVGEVKILHNPSAGSHRIVMRRDFVLNICANHIITGDMDLAPAFGSDKAWVWFTAADMANEVRPVLPNFLSPLFGTFCLSVLLNYLSVRRNYLSTQIFLALSFFLF